MLAALVIPLIGAHTIGAEDNSEAFLFLGVEAMAKTGKTFHPISSVRKKHIFIDDGGQTKRLPIKSDCVLRTQWVMTEKFADVLEMNTSLSRTASSRELDAMAGMIRHERRSATLASDARNRGNNRAAESIEENNRDFQSSVQDLIDRGELEEKGLADTVSIETTILPALDLKNSYLVACVTYDIEDPDTGALLQRGGSARAHYLGNLKKGEIHEVKFKAVMKAFKEEGAEVTMHLYSGNGDQIALSNSPSLKRLTPEQVQKLLETAQQ